MKRFWFVIFLGLISFSTGAVEIKFISPERAITRLLAGIPIGRIQLDRTANKMSITGPVVINLMKLPINDQVVLRRMFQKLFSGEISAANNGLTLDMSAAHISYVDVTPPEIALSDRELIAYLEANDEVLPKRSGDGFSSVELDQIASDLERANYLAKPTSIGVSSLDLLGRISRFESFSCSSNLTE